MKPYTLLKNYCKYTFTTGFILSDPSNRFVKDRYVFFGSPNPNLNNVVSSMNNIMIFIQYFPHIIYYKTVDAIITPICPILIPYFIYLHFINNNKPIKKDEN